MVGSKLRNYMDTITPMPRDDSYALDRCTFSVLELIHAAMFCVDNTLTLFMSEI